MGLKVMRMICDNGKDAVKQTNSMFGLLYWVVLDTRHMLYFNLGTFPLRTGNYFGSM